MVKRKTDADSWDLPAFAGRSVVVKVVWEEDEHFCSVIRRGQSHYHFHPNITEEGYKRISRLLIDRGFHNIILNIWVK